MAARKKPTARASRGAAQLTLDSPAEVLSHPEVIASYLGTEEGVPGLAHAGHHRNGANPPVAAAPATDPARVHPS